jgi:hypothetical protein
MPAVTAIVVLGGGCLVALRLGATLFSLPRGPANGPATATAGSAR